MSEDLLILVVAALAALGASALTLFSGFGLATLLTPLFVFFLPVPLAIAAVAVVHLLNNLYKLALVGRSADRRIVVQFGIPAAAAAVAGAALLVVLADLPAMATYELLGPHEVSVVKVVVGAIIVGAAAFELAGAGPAAHANRRTLVAGGLASGFLGGLSGSQGPLRAAVLLRAGLEPRAYIGSNVLCAVLVDVGRLTIYGSTFASLTTVGQDPGLLRLVVVATLAAMIGATIAARASRRVTSAGIRRLTAGLMIIVGLGLGAGLI